MALSPKTKEKLASAFGRGEVVDAMADLPIGHYHDAKGNAVDRLGRKIVTRAEIDREVDRHFGTPLQKFLIGLGIW